MAVSKAQQASVNKYVKANYDRINITMPKGEKEVIQERAAAHGESVNGFIVRSIRERMERDGWRGGGSWRGPGQAGTRGNARRRPAAAHRNGTGDRGYPGIP